MLGVKGEAIQVLPVSSSPQPITPVPFAGSLPFCALHVVPSSNISPFFPGGQTPPSLKRFRAWVHAYLGVGVLHGTAQDSTSHHALVQCCLLEALPEVQLWKAWTISSRVY